MIALKELQLEFLIWLLLHSVSWLFTTYFSKEEEKIPLVFFATLQVLSAGWACFIAVKFVSFLIGLALLVVCLISVVSDLLEGFGHNLSKRFKLYNFFITFVCVVICFLYFLFS